MSCLEYVLDIFNANTEVKILYNSNHCIAVDDLSTTNNPPNISNINWTVDQYLFPSVLFTNTSENITLRSLTIFKY